MRLTLLCGHGGLFQAQQRRGEGHNFLRATMQQREGRGITSCVQLYRDVGLQCTWSCTVQSPQVTQVEVQILSSVFPAAAGHYDTNSHIHTLAGSPPAPVSVCTYMSILCIVYSARYIYSHPGVDRIPGFSKIKRSFSKPIDRIWQMKPSRSGQKVENPKKFHILSMGSKSTVFFKK